MRNIPLSFLQRLLKLTLLSDEQLDLTPKELYPEFIKILEHAQLLTNTMRKWTFQELREKYENNPVERKGRS